MAEEGAEAAPAKPGLITTGTQQLANLAEDANENLEENSYAPMVWFCLTRETQPRKLCIAIMENPWFDRIVMLLITISSLKMVADNPILTHQATELDEKLDQDWGCGPGKHFQELIDITAEKNKVDEYFELVFLSLFTVELLIKVIALGLFLEKGSYFRSTWNWLDAIVVISGWITQILTRTADGGEGGTGGLKVLRLFRLLRPLRALQRVRGLRVLVQCILAALPQMLRVFGVLTMTVAFFGIIGTQLLEGALRHQCFTPQHDDAGNIIGWDPTGYVCDPECKWDSVTQQLEPEGCQSLGPKTKRTGNLETYGWGTWHCQEPAQQCLCGESAANDAYCRNDDNPNYGANSFDNMGSAMMTIFQSISLEGWVDIMYMIQDGKDLTVAWVYQIAIVLVGALIVMNLFLAVLADQFAMAEESNPEEEDEVDEEKVLEDSIKSLSHSSAVRQFCLDVVRSTKFDRFVLACIFVNTLTMMLEWYPARPDEYGDHLKSTSFSPPAKFYTLWGINAFLTLVFTCESGLKIVGVGPKIFAKDNWNIFDSVVVFVSLVEIVFDLLGSAFLDTDVQAPSVGLSGLRALRVFRVFKMARSFETIRQIIATLLLSLRSVVYLGLLLLLFIFIFALLGMEWFGGVIPETRIPPWMPHEYTSTNFPCTFHKYGITWPDDEEAPRNNFNTFPDSFVSIFIVLSGENWNEIYFAMHRATWNNSKIELVPGVATYYFILLFVIGNLLLFNLFIAILISNMEGDDDEEGGDASEDGGKSAASKVYMTFTRGAYGTPAEDGTMKVMKLERSNTTALRSKSSTSTPDGVTPLSKAEVFLQDTRGSDDRSLFLFSWGNPVRIFCTKMVYHPAFDQVVLVLILASSVLLGIDWPGWGEDHPFKQAAKVVDIIFAVLFLSEMLIKIVVMGFIYSKDKERPPYLCNGWNVLDFIVVCISILNLIAMAVPELAALGPLRNIRTLRALRPLRLIVRLENMRIVVSTLFGAVPAVGTFSVVMLLFVIIFAILFVQLFGARLGYCLDPAYDDPGGRGRMTPGFNHNASDPNTPYGNDYWECMALPKYNLSRHDSYGYSLTDPIFSTEYLADGSKNEKYWGPDGYKEYTLFPQWVQPDFGHFDNIVNAVGLLLEIACLEGWPDVMFWMMDSDMNEQYIQPYWLDTATSPDGLNGQDHSTSYPIAASFIIIWIVLGCFVLLNMVIGVVLDSFNKIKAENDGLTMMTEEQGEWVRAQKQIISMRPLKKRPPPIAPWRQKVYSVVSSNSFEVTVLGVILINMLFMMLTVWHPTEFDSSIGRTLYNINTISNYIFFTLYVIEMLLKWVGLGVASYFKDTSNLFDFFLVLFTTVDVVFTVSKLDMGFPPALLRVIRLTRVVRVLRILNTAKSLRTIVTTIRVSLPGLYNISILLFLVLYIYAVMCVNFFWAVNYTPGDIYPYGFPDDIEPSMQLLYSDDYYYTNDNSNGGDYINRHASFRNIANALLLLFRCSTGESFNGIMHDLMDSSWGTNVLRCCPTCGPVVDGVAANSCGLSFWAAIIFWSFALVMGFIILNGLFIGVIVDNFTSIGSEAGHITVEAIEEFREVWLTFDPKGTFFIQTSDIMPLLQHLSPPLGVREQKKSRKEMLAFLEELQIPDHHGRAHFAEVLTSLSYHECGVPVPVCDTTKRLTKALAKSPHLTKLPETEHDALSAYLVSLMQARVRAYHARMNGDQAPVQSVYGGGGGKDGGATKEAAAEGNRTKVRSNKVVPANQEA